MNNVTMFPIRTIPTLCCLLLMVGVVGQPTAVLRGTVIDAASRLALPGAHILVVGTGTVAVADRAGMFDVAVAVGRPVEVEVTNIGYAALHRSFDAGEVRSGRSVVIALVRVAVELPPVDIARPAPEVVYQRSDLHVGDYFTNHEGLWVLTYTRPRLWHPQAQAGRQVYKDARLHLLDTAFVEQCSVRLPTEVVGLRHDHARRTIVEGINGAWVATAVLDEVQLQPIDLVTLHERILPWTDSIQGALLGNDHSTTFPAFEHYSFDPGTREARSICTVEDRFLMELFRSQYKYMSGADKVIAMDLGRELKVDPEIIAGYMTEFHKDIYFEPPYAPLFVIRDTLCVFDHHAERIRRFLPDRTPVDEVPINYHQEKTWRSRLVQDAQDGSVHALFARQQHTWLRRVDPTTGTLGPIVRLDHPYPTDVQVCGGHAYFIHRTYGSLQHRTLYRQPLR